MKLHVSNEEDETLKHPAGYLDLGASEAGGSPWFRRYYMVPPSEPEGTPWFRISDGTTWFIRDTAGEAKAPHRPPLRLQAGGGLRASEAGGAGLAV